jgi:hypothetical protein
MSAAAGALPVAPASASSKKPPVSPAPRDIVFRRWSSDAELATGTGAGVAIASGALTLATVAGQRSYTDPFTASSGTYDYATWTSTSVPLGFAATEAIPSWTASTPEGAWVEIELRGVTELGNTTKWYVLGRWAQDDATIARTSVPAQGDTDGSVSIDTFVAAAGHGWTSYQLRVTLLRPAGSALTPQIRSLGVMASRLPAPGTVVASTPALAQGVVLPVPQFSQSIHEGQYPQWNGGGEAWCSPTSTSMVVAHWGTGPAPADYAWVDPAYADPWVDYAARHTYDSNYAGTGNWPFNTAYAGRFGLDGFVTRLRSLNEAEKFIAAGIALVFSLSFKKGKIPGLTYGTNGHLLVLAGFTATGEPVLNDPAAPSDAAVRKTVGRAEFEAAWLDSSRGIVYVIYPASLALPAPGAQANW